MKLRLAFLLILVLALFSCKREYVSFQKSPVRGNIQAPDGLSQNSEEQKNAIENGRNKNSIVSAQIAREALRGEKRAIRKRIQTEEPTAKDSVFSERKKELKQTQKIKKEVNPRLSRALWMTIPAGLAVILGIALYSVAPTGLFIFAFSIVFLVGLVSLFLYLANPKPKM